MDQAIPHFIALPTTAGTGSEVGRSSVISDDETHVKKIIFHPKFLPGVTICSTVIASSWKIRPCRGVAGQARAMCPLI